MFVDVATRIYGVCILWGLWYVLGTLSHVSMYWFLGASLGVGGFVSSMPWPMGVGVGMGEYILSIPWRLCVLVCSKVSTSSRVRVANCM